jgi:hypothetical protein
VHDVQCRGQAGTLRQPCFIFLGVGISLSTETLNVLWERKDLISMIKPVENANLDNFYSKAGCYVASMVFSISKNISAGDIRVLLLKFKVTGSVSLIAEVPC